MLQESTQALNAIEAVVLNIDCDHICSRLIVIEYCGFAVLSHQRPLSEINPRLQVSVMPEILRSWQYL